MGRNQNERVEIHKPIQPHSIQTKKQAQSALCNGSCLFYFHHFRIETMHEKTDDNHN